MNGCFVDPGKTWYLAASPMTRNDMTPSRKEAEAWCAAHTVKVAQDGQSLTLWGDRKCAVRPATSANDLLVLDCPEATAEFPTSLGLMHMLTCDKESATMQACQAETPQVCTQLRVVDSMDACAKAYIGNHHDGK